MIRNKFAQSLRAGLEDNMTLQQAMAFAKEEFISSLQYMDLHQLGEITAFGISILGQVTSDILTCNHITEAQRFAILMEALPVTGTRWSSSLPCKSYYLTWLRSASRHRRALGEVEADNSVFVALCESYLAELR